jgi:hypothetical protein
MASEARTIDSDAHARSESAQVTAACAASSTRHFILLDRRSRLPVMMAGVCIASSKALRFPSHLPVAALPGSSSGGKVRLITVFRSAILRVLAPTTGASVSNGHRLLELCV